MHGTGAGSLVATLGSAMVEAIGCARTFPTDEEAPLPPAKKTTSRRTAARKRSTARKRTSARKRARSTEPAALKRLNKSLDTAQTALNALRKDVGKDVGTGARSLYKDLEKFVREARKDSGKLSKALERDVARAQKKLASAARQGAGRGTARKSTARKSTARKSTARKSTARKSTARRSGSRTASRSRSR
jgi:hypothetical protein